MQTNKVSNKKITIRRNKPDLRPIKGGDWIPIKFPNIALISMKNSGKTTVIDNLIERLTGSKTKIIVVCSTINKDNSWIKMVKRYAKKRDMETFTEDINGVLQTFIENTTPENTNIEQPIQPQQPTKKLTYWDKLEYEKKLIEEAKEVKEEKQPKELKGLLTPDYMIILDDISDELRNSMQLTKLMKENRHSKADIIISSQYYTDLSPSQLSQLNVILIFKSFPVEKLERMHDGLRLNIPLDKFLEIYDDATQDKYNFLYIDRDNNKYRKNFTDEYVI